MVPWKQWWRSITGVENRSAVRRRAPAIVAYYWDGGTPTAYQVRDISETGFFLHTKARWYPGTLVLVTLQRTQETADGGPIAVTVQSRVVRAESDGVGFAFVTSSANRTNRERALYSDGADRKTLSSFLGQIRATAVAGHSLHSEQAQALVEYILMIPLIFLLVINMVNFGGFFYAWITVANASRAGADYYVLGGSSAGHPTLATGQNVYDLINTDIISLPNASSLSVNACRNNRGTVTADYGSCATIPSDPESSNYVLKTVDVSYTYQPFIPAQFSFPRLNIYATLPSNLVIHRRAVMRSIQ